MAFIKINENNRITAASIKYHCGAGEIEVEIPDEINIQSIHEYLYVNGTFVHEPVPIKSAEESPSQLDIIEAQVAYTAMMTGTLLEG